jgi:anti-sigma B factor antagonist
MVMEEPVNRPDFPSHGSRPRSSELELAVVGDVPEGRVLATGELDMLTAPRLGTLLMELLHRGYRKITVDVAGLDFCGAAGLHVLCDTTRCYRTVGGRLQVIALPPHLRRVLVLAQVDGELEIGSRDGDGPGSWRAIRSDGFSSRPTRLPRSARR